MDYKSHAVAILGEAGVLFLLLTGSVQSHCERGRTCDDAGTMLTDIVSDPKSYQQLLQVFYPINKAHDRQMNLNSLTLK